MHANLPVHWNGPAYLKFFIESVPVDSRQQPHPSPIFALKALLISFQLISQFTHIFSKLDHFRDLWNIVYINEMH
jgi:hypothetical protein